MTLVSLPLAFSVLPILGGLVMTLFVLSALLLVTVVLLQEGKGGGIAGAFGGAAAETFGVKAGSVNRFTSYVAFAFVLLALIHAGISSNTSGSVIAPAPPKSAGELNPAPGGEHPGTPAGMETPPGMDTTPPPGMETPPGGAPPAPPPPANPPPDKPPTEPPPATPPAPAPSPAPAPAPESPPPAPGMNP